MKNFIFSQLQKTNVWIGLIGLVFTLLGFSLGLIFLFVALIVTPEEKVAAKFKEWTEKLKNL